MNFSIRSLAIAVGFFILLMAKDGFDEVQWKLEEITSELKTATDPERRRTLLREMSRLVAEAERISSQPPKMIQKQA